MNSSAWIAPHEIHDMNRCSLQLLSAWMASTWTCLWISANGHWISPSVSLPGEKYPANTLEIRSWTQTLFVLSSSHRDWDSKRNRSLLWQLPIQQCCQHYAEQNESGSNVFDWIPPVNIRIVNGDLVGYQWHPVGRHCRIDSRWFIALSSNARSFRLLQFALSSLCELHEKTLQCLHLAK